MGPRGSGQAQQRRPQASDARIEVACRARDLMMRDLSNTLTIDELARACDVSPTVLKESFRATFGMPVYTWYRLFRMRCAAELLVRRPNVTVAQVAAEVGYANPSKFGAAFAKTMGVPPSVWREQQLAARGEVSPKAVRPRYNSSTIVSSEWSYTLLEGVVDMSMILHESAEMYLETIHVLQEENNGRVRAVDIASRMGFSKPTISEWMGKLRDGGYVQVDNTGNIGLTPAGEEVANHIYERHLVLTRLFRAVGVDAEVAEEDACRVEHYISDETFEALRSHLETLGA